MMSDEKFKALLAFLVQMRWVIVIGAVIILALHFGIDPMVILDWLKELLPALSGG